MVPCRHLSFSIINYNSFLTLLIYETRKQFFFDPCVHSATTIQSEIEVFSLLSLHLFSIKSTSRRPSLLFYFSDDGIRSFGLVSALDKSSCFADSMLVNTKTNV